ncbi:hypothetical protein RclHR1_27370002 [Rhizophagus clarus]|uniref:NrS-1 polymerase-like helicase domain-containing protein n=1 Tax=Rhizophagus clarus TaxID=94130 RepID=A0A2Z6R679_9GLOM|nr:hypothetical protein RclHR1_27370002 [Rhizophagus clarus]GES78025.1 hypothetical protein GLOIN_2v1877063 [Rhizophagus clarus]
MNETGMSSEEWHRFNEHLKSLITEGKVSIECKGLKQKRLDDFAGYMITSNHDAPLKVDIGDSRVVYFKVSARCRNDISYFNQLREILDHPDAPEVIISYLLNRNLTNWRPRKIPNYLEWCRENGEKPFTNNTLGQKFSDIYIDQIRLQDNGVRVYFFIINHSKIMTRFRELGLGDMEEFSDIPQDDLPKNKTTDIPIFNMSETSPQKIILPQPEKNTPLANTNKDRKADKQDESFQTLFDYMAEDTYAILLESALVTSTSGTSETSESPKSVVDKSKTTKLPDSSKPINKNRMEMDSRMCSWAIEMEDDPKEDMDMTVRERLIGEEIICHRLEDNGITTL